MTIDYKFKKGVDIPAAHWLKQFTFGPIYHGCGMVYDGNRYIYVVAQYGSSSTGASTTLLTAYCTWTCGWQYLATTTSGNRGLDLEYDPVRNVLYIIHGAALNSWQVFNLNTTPVTIANVSCAARVLTTMTPVLPANADYGASLCLVNDTSMPTEIDTGTCSSTSTATSIVDDLTGKSAGSFVGGMIGCYVEFTSGTLLGTRRLITAVPNPYTLTTAAFTLAPAATDTFKIILPTGTATSGSSTTLVMSGAGWTSNLYRNSDVMIISGTGSGQRRRIGSHTSDTITLAAAVTGNARTGNWTTAPDSTSVFRIVPSSDFLYYIPGSTSNVLHKLDVVQTTGAAWSSSLGGMPAAPSGGANLLYPKVCAPFNILSTRGNSSSNYYMRNIGLDTWTTLTTYWSSETISTGSSCALICGGRRTAIVKENSSRIYAHDNTTGVLSPFSTLPYATSGGYDGRRMVYVKTADGVEYLYILRSGGQEFFRIALEWLD